MIHVLPPGLTREALLVVLCARSHVDAATGARIRQLAQHGVEWGAVVELAKWHGVVPLVYQNLRQWHPHAIDGCMGEALRRYVQATALLNRVLAKELTGLLDDFKARGIPAMSVKGPTLALCAYGNLTLREFDDLDLIVAKEEIVKATEVLVERGYRITSIATEGRDTGEEIFHLFRHKHNPVFRVDLQWVMAGSSFGFRLDRKTFWERRRVLMLESGPASTLSPEDLLIVLGVHGSKHAWTELKWACDVAELLRATQRIDWQYVERSAKAMGCWRLVLMGLAMAQSLFDVPLPQSICEALANDDDLQDLVGRMPETLLADPADGVAEADAEAFYFVLKDSWWQQWWFGLQLCHGDSHVVRTPPGWVRQGTALRWLSRRLKPIHRAAVTIIPTGRIRQSIVRWLYGAA